MTENPYPIPRQLRQSDILLGDGGDTYGPFEFEIFDPEDVVVCVRPSNSLRFEEEAGVVVTKVNGNTPLNPLDNFRIRFPAAIPDTTRYVVLSSRLAARAAGVLSGTRIDPDALEKEFSKIATQQQELRRDLGRAVVADFGAPAFTLDADLQDGDTLMKSGDRLVKGANAGDIANAAGYAEQVSQGYQATNALLGTLLPTYKKMWSDVNRKIVEGHPVLGACIGDSMTYGQQLNPPGPTPPINGSTEPRMATPWPEQLQVALQTTVFGSNVTVLNWGFSGDTAGNAIDRWLGRTENLDFLWIMLGQNDFGQNVSISTFRENIMTLVAHFAGRGTAVGLISTLSTQNLVGNQGTHPYRSVMRELADYLGLPFVDAWKQTQHIAYTSQRWQVDGLHPAAGLCRELGYHISAWMMHYGQRQPFAAGPGVTLYATDGLCFSNGVDIWPQTSVGARSGEVIVIAPGAVVAIPLHVTAPCVPIVETLNPDGFTRNLTYVYAGVDTVFLGNEEPYVPGTSRRAYALPRLEPGYRLMVFRNDGPDHAQIDAIHFKDTTSAQSAGGMFRSVGLAGFGRPKWAQEEWFARSNVYHRQCRAISASMRLSHNGGQGLALFRDNAQNLWIGSENALIIMRVGANLQIRHRVAGGDFDAGGWFGGVFPSTGIVTVKIDVEITAGNTKVWVDNVFVGERADPPNYFGYPAIVSYAEGICEALTFTVVDD